LIKVLFAQVNGIGDYEVYWDGKDMNGVEVPSGTYIYVLNTQDHILSGKMTLMK
jgi:flagellar hook assembly protein FlgD